MTAELPPLMQEEDKASDPRTTRLGICLILNFLTYVARQVTGRLVGRPATSRLIGLLSPNFTAFTIWQAIFALQALFVLWPAWIWFKKTMTERQASQLLAASPWFIGNMVTSMYWRLGSGLLLEITLEAAIVLTLTWVCLLMGHFAVATQANFTEFFTMDAPITMQLGWGTAAMLLSWNSVATMHLSVSAQIAVLFLQLIFAVGFATTCAMRTRSALLACTVAWALFWVGYQTLIPAPAARLDTYNDAFGEAGRVALGVVQVVLAAGLVGVGVFFRNKGEEVVEA